MGAVSTDTNRTGVEINDAFLLTNNPARWEIDPDVMADWVEATANGYPVEGSWSTGLTTRAISVGDRAFLLRQGHGQRGIFASGTIVSDVYQDEHWDGSGRSANFADVMWDTALDPEDCLPIETLFAEMPNGNWEPQSSGTRIKPELVNDLQALWAQHVTKARAVSSTTADPHSSIPAGQGRRLDAALRKEIEDLAQARLSAVYTSEGWRVEDLRYGNPFDAKATKGDEVLYLEAKGTVTNGERVIVTRGEVDWARRHAGQCIIGILSDINVDRTGAVDPASGTLRQYLWNPEDEDLFALTYDYFPPEDLEV